jgi:hypothetical protein
MPARGHAEAQPVRGWVEAGSLPLVATDLAPWGGGGTSFESYDFWVWLDDGRYMKLQFVVTSMRAGFFKIARQGSVKAVVAPMGQTTTDETRDGVFRARRGFSGQDGEWSSSDDAFNLVFDDCYLRGDGRTFHLALLDDRVKTELDLTLDRPLWQAGDGITRFGWDGDTTMTEHILPRFSVTGRLSTRQSKKDAEQWQPITGRGYAEHRRISSFPSSVGERWTSFRALRDDGLTITMNHLQTPDTYGHATLGWLTVSLGNEILFASRDLILKPVDVRNQAIEPSNYPVLFGYRVQARSGADEVELTVTDGHIELRENPLASVSPVLRAVLASALAPMDYELSNRYEATLRIGGAVAAVAGTGWTTLSYPK